MTQQNIENIIQENVQLHTKVSVLEEQLENVQRQLAWLKKQIFGRKTEQASVIMADGIQLSLLNEEISETEDKSENHVFVLRYLPRFSPAASVPKNCLPI